MANPPAPDVEAVVGAVGGAVTPDTPLHRALLALRAPHAALARVPNTVRQSIADVLVDGANRAFLAERHTASLQARVEELERERDEADAAATRWFETHLSHRTALDALGKANGELFKRAYEAESERDHFRALWKDARAALRPADETVTQREM